MRLTLLDPLGILFIRLSMVLNVGWFILLSKYAKNSIERLECQGMAAGYYKVFTGEFRLTRGMLGSKLDMINALLILAVVGYVTDVIQAILGR